MANVATNIVKKWRRTSVSSSAGGNIHASIVLHRKNSLESGTHVIHFLPEETLEDISLDEENA
jgi:hypothetical protein